MGWDDDNKPIMRIMNAGRLVVCLAVMFQTAIAVPAQVPLGDAPQAPTDLTGLPGGGPRPLVVTGGFAVDTTSREQVREFYNAVYLATVGVAINSTAVVANCVPGTNSPLFANATVRRLTWFRAMAGIPAAVTFDAGESGQDQSAALMMAAQGALQHIGNWTGWNCLSADGTNAARNSNLALSYNGPDAISVYMCDFGANNYEVGHRRWLLYPQTQIMAAGDVPAQGSDYSANATWAFDANYGGPRPATRTNYVAWPPPGYVPYQVVYPRWSFALANAGFTNATVTMTSGGLPMAVTQQTYVAGYGENTLVWYPAGLDPTTATVFPFSGADTVYSVTISNVVTAAGTNSYSYHVTLVDPAVPGADYFPLVISGTNQPIVNTATAYSCTPSANPNSTSYQWISAQLTNGNVLVNIVTNTTASTNLIFTPTQTGNYTLQAQRILFGEFPVDPSTNRQVTVMAGPPLITLKTPVITGGLVKINFTLVSGTATNFHLLQANRLGGSWTTNGTAVFTTNVAGSAYQFTTTNGAATRYYRVQTP